MQSGKETQDINESGHETERPSTSDEKPPTVPPRKLMVEGDPAAPKKERYFDKFGNWVNFLTLLFVAAYTVITFVQWRSNHIFNKKQLRSINSQLTEMRSSSSQTEQTIRVLKKQANTARQQFEMSQRPWVSADIGIGDLTWRDGEARFNLLITLRNTGHSPGLSVDISSVAIASFDPNEILAKQKEMAESRRHAPSKLGTLVFPGDVIPMRHNIALSLDEINKLERNIREFYSNSSAIDHVPIAVLITIDYRFAGSVDHHQTGYTMNLFWHDPSQPSIPGLSVPIGMNISARDLRLEDQIFGQYAD
jgi:hypothetical protein